MSITKLIYITLFSASVSSCTYAPPAFSAGDVKPTPPKAKAVKPPPKTPVKPYVRPLARNPHRADGSTVGCKVLIPYDAYFKQPVYACPDNKGGAFMVLADGSKYYKP